MDTLALYKEINIADNEFPVQITQCVFDEPGPSMDFHWHNHMQFYLFTNGTGIIHLDGKDIPVSANDTIIINSNELHYMENLCTNLQVTIVRIDFSAMAPNELDICHLKYIAPITQNLILFENKINDLTFRNCLKNIINEYENRNEISGLAFKAFAYQLLLIMYKNYCKKILNGKESIEKINRLKQFKCVFDFIESQYHEKIRLDQLAEMMHVSRHHFCRLFRNFTGYSPIDYINRTRIEKAYLLLKQGTLNITEVAFSTGFDDANYFSRLFKYYKKTTPSKVLKRET